MRDLKTLFFNITQQKSEINFILTREKNYTYGETFNLAKKYANNLSALGVKKGDRVALITEKRPEQIFSLLAIWNIGAIAVPINENLNKQELNFVLNDCTPILTIVSDKLFDSLEISNKILLNTLGNEHTQIEVSNFNEEDSLACLVYTSGSTGNPKGVMLSHKNFYINARSIVIGGNFLPSDIFYSILPYWHSFALTSELVSAILVGGKIAITSSNKTFASDLSFFNPSIIFVVPRVVEMFKENVLKKFQSLGEDTYKIFNDALNLAETLVGDTPYNKNPEIYEKLKINIFNKIKATFGSNLRYLISGGAPININLQRFFGALDIKIMQGYGLTEASPVISVDIIDTYLFGSCGSLLPWLFSENGDFTFVDSHGVMGKNLKGELLVKGSCVMLGYWGHKDQSAKAIINDWLYTGDIGYFKHNKLFLSGRKNNMIVLTGGENIHPEFLENILKDSVIINDLMIFGDKCKNLYAIITLNDGFENNNDIYQKLKDEIKMLTQNLTSFQKPIDFIIVPQFSPENNTYTATQKIRRYQILSLYKSEINNLLHSHGEKNLL